MERFTLLSVSADGVITLENGLPCYVIASVDDVMVADTGARVTCGCADSKSHHAKNADL